MKFQGPKYFGFQDQGTLIDYFQFLQKVAELCQYFTQRALKLISTSTYGQSTVYQIPTLYVKSILTYSVCKKMLQTERTNQSDLLTSLKL